MFCSPGILTFHFGALFHGPSSTSKWPFSFSSHPSVKLKLVPPFAALSVPVVSPPPEVSIVSMSFHPFFSFSLSLPSQ